MTWFARPTILGARLEACLFAFLLAAALLVPVSKAQAMKIQEVKSPGGISAWLVEEHSVPLIALRFAFDGGSSQDPRARRGSPISWPPCSTRAPAT
jgi:zinc protease